MNRYRATVKMIFISPEVVCALLPFLAYVYLPAFADVLAKPMKDSVAFGFGAVVIPLGMLAFNYREGLDILAPTGSRKVILDWPDYPLLKAAVVLSLVWCSLGTAAAIISVWMVAADVMPRLAVTILVTGILASAATTATVGLARFTGREILGE